MTTLSRTRRQSRHSSRGFARSVTRSSARTLPASRARRWRRVALGAVVSLGFARAIVPLGASAFEAAADAPSHVVRVSGSQITGTVVETMNAAGYSYVRVETAAGEVWAAGPQVAVEVGDTASFDRGMAMANFRSKALDRTFEEILFVSAIRVGDAPAAASGASPRGESRAAGSPHDGVGAGAGSSVDLSGIAKPEGGVTVGEAYSDKAALAGTHVLIRARVVKSNSGIMGRNWLHLRDGTAGPGGENDLTVTTSGTAKVGDTVQVRGTLTTEKDFGFGYRYELIIEDATVTVLSRTSPRAQP